MIEEKKVAARVLRRIRVLPTDNPKVAVLKLENESGAEHFAVTRQAMLDIANHLIKAAERFEDDGEGKGVEHGVH